MSFKYQYVPVEELQATPYNSGPLAEGMAEFKIDSIFQTDKTGAPLVTREGVSKIKIKLLCIDCKGHSGIVWHDISAKMPWALIGLGDAIGRQVYNKSGTMDWDSLVGSSGKCVLENRSSPGYPDRTTVKNYLARTDGLSRSDMPAEPVGIEEDDDIPF